MFNLKGKGVAWKQFVLLFKQTSVNNDATKTTDTYKQRKSKT